MKHPKDKFIFILITGICTICLVNSSNGICRQKPQQLAFHLTNQVPKSPLGLQQCERECFSDTNCQVMVYNVNNLVCYKATSVGSVVATGDLNFIVKLRSEIASNLEFSYLCKNHNCETGFSCVALSSGDLVCMAGLCKQPVNIKNSVVNFNTYSISSTATYSCNIGYHSIGTNTTTCGSSLEWTRATLVCCKNGFTYDQGTKMMYKVISENKKYDEAIRYCDDLGSGLVRINSTKRMNVLSRYLSIGQYFTDASDRITEGNWIFSDGSDVDMTLFPPREPDGGTYENCAVFGAGSNLYDVNCDTNRNFICEVR